MSRDTARVSFTPTTDLKGNRLLSVEEEAIEDAFELAWSAAECLGQRVANQKHLIESQAQKIDKLEDHKKNLQWEVRQLRLANTDLESAARSRCRELADVQAENARLDVEILNLKRVARFKEQTRAVNSAVDWSATSRINPPPTASPTDDTSLLIVKLAKLAEELGDVKRVFSIYRAANPDG